MWIRSFVTFCGVLTAAVPALITPAQACSLAGNQEHIIDPQAQATDASPPSAPVVTVQTIQRGQGPEYHGCSQSVSSCDDLGWIIVQVSATDDQTAVGSLGYRIELASGSLPSGLALPATAVRPATSGGLLFSWIDGRSGVSDCLWRHAAAHASQRGPRRRFALRGGSG